ncbi:GerAB/ArcD/ProY family transporter [Paenibacillus protaetiae]|nr:GerAB/ArcD/ProY family transporter [Paenibacillus protaetiae]
MNTTNKFGILSFYMIMLLSVGLANHVIVLPLLLDAAKRDAWLSVPIAMVIMMIWSVLLFYKVTRSMAGIRIDVWLKQRIPSGLAYGMVWLLLGIQLFIAYTTLVETAEWTASTYLPDTPVIVVSVVMVALCGFAAWNGIQAIAYTACILLPIVFVLGDFVMSVNMPQKDYLFLLPIMEHGYWPVIRGTAYSVSSFAEIYSLLLIQQHLSKPIRRWQLLLLSFFLAILTFGPTTGTIAEFGPVEADKLRFPAFSQWRLVVIGKYLEHVDFFAVFQWMSGALIRISIPLYLLSEFAPFRASRYKTATLTVICAGLSVSAYFTFRHMFAFKRLLDQYFAYIWILVIAIVFLLWAFTFIKQKKGAGV